MKKQYSYPLIGLDVHGNPARIATDVNIFESEDAYFRVTEVTDKSCTLATPKDKYTLPFKNGRYEGTCDGFKVHVCLKKIVGTLHTWF